MKGSKTLRALELRQKNKPKDDNGYTFHMPGSRNPKKGYKGKHVSKY